MGTPLATTLSGYTSTELGHRSRDYLQALQKQFQEETYKMYLGCDIGEQSKYVTVRFDDKQVKKWDTLELIQLTDIQFGSKGCKLNRVIEYRDWVLSEPNRFILLTGDNIDAATIFSPGTPWDNLFGPQSQAYRFAEIFAPARHRILGYVGGNHERRAMPSFGDIGTLIAILLQIPYSCGKQVIDIHFGQHKPFKVALWHGVGGARTKGAVAQVLDRFMQWGDSQLYLMGHLHQGMIVPAWREYRDGRGALKLEKRIAAIGTSFLESWGGYGEVAGFQPHDVMMARAVLEKDGKWEMTLK